MIGTWASLSCALKTLPSTPNPILDKARTHLEVGVALAFFYTETWHSIRWNKSRAGKKKGVRYRLDCIAFDTYTELLAAAEYLNKYAASGEELPPNWGELLGSMNQAYRCIQEEHRYQLNSKQLGLEVELHPVNIPLKLKELEVELIQIEENVDERYSNS